MRGDEYIDIIMIFIQLFCDNFFIISSYLPNNKKKTKRKNESKNIIKVCERVI